MPSSLSLMPHAVCWRQDSALIWTMAVTNAVTFLSYTGICLTLFYLVRKTKQVIAREWAFFVVGFALFIVACGSTHFMEVVTTWVPWFWVDAWANIVTALLSGYVAVQLFRRAQVIGFSVNDYADRLASTETEKIRMQESLLAAQKIEDWSRMSAVMSHEIANPLESIQNLLYLIEHTEGATPSATELVHKASEEATRVLTISRSTLEFFRQNATPEMVDLEAAAESVRFVLAGVLRERGVGLEIDARGDVQVEAMPGETRQVLLNLVRNAVEATSAVGEVVRITLAGGTDGVKVIVADCGAGIAEGLLPTLFNFGMTTKGSLGNGMGLWTARHILTRHGGKIDVASEIGKGTRFTLWWPRAYPKVDRAVADVGKRTGMLAVDSTANAFSA
jgi:signal transduction histidine kinase